MDKSITQFNEKLLKACRIRGVDADSSLTTQGRPLTDILLESGVIESGPANAILEEVTGIQSLDPTFVSFTDQFLSHMRQMIPKKVAVGEKVFAVKHEGNHVHLVMSFPEDESCLRKMEALTGSRIKPYCCHTGAVSEAIGMYYGDGDGEPDEAPDIDVLTDNALNTLHALKMANAPVMELVNAAPVVLLLQFMLNDLVAKGASDLHFEPQEKTFRIRCRRDGVMQSVWSFPSVIGAGIIPRLKMISQMDLSKTKQPQDGSINYHLIQNRDIDVRTSALPSLYGEKLVLRILEKDKKKLTLQDLGMDSAEFEKMNHIVHRPGGLLLVTGPTGSGKTTTLYAVLNDLNSEQVNIVTAEDPVEYKMDGLTQINCSSEDGVTFREALKSFLRQDPDIIMVGEIRDVETADIALKAAMTGHMVLSTLHTNDAPSAVQRLINMGIPPYLAASARISVVAQRLMRKLCVHCKASYVPEKEALMILGVEDSTEVQYFQSTGCDQCAGTGYSGRIGIYELLTVKEELVNLILSEAPASALKAAAVKNGMITLRDAALAKAQAGITSLEEVLRVTMEE